MIHEALAADAVRRILFWCCWTMVIPAGLLLVSACTASPEDGSLIDPKQSFVGKAGARPTFVIINPNVDPADNGSARKTAEAISAIADCDTTIVHFLHATSKYVRRLAPQGIIITGQGTPWEEYSADSLKDVMKLIREADCPVLGICGGHQLIAQAYGAKVDRIKRLSPGKGYEGCWRESGFVEVQTLVKDPVLGDAGKTLTVQEAHYEEVKQVPRGFVVTASNASCPIQAMRHRTRPVFGVQFHPERWDDSHPDGRDVLKRFLNVCAERTDRAGG